MPEFNKNPLENKGQEKIEVKENVDIKKYHEFMKTFTTGTWKNKSLNLPDYDFFITNKKGEKVHGYFETEFKEGEESSDPEAQRSICRYYIADEPGKEDGPQTLLVELDLSNNTASNSIEEIKEIFKKMDII